MGTLEEELVAEAADLSRTPTEEGSARLRRLGVELMELERRQTSLTEDLTAVTKRINAIKSADMPALMEEVGQDRIGLPDQDVDLVLEPFYHANISAEWDDNRREAAFNYLRDNDAEALVKAQFTVLAARGEGKKMRQLMERVKQMLAELELDAVITPSLAVPWGTLTAWVREQIQGGRPVDLEKLGATVGQTVKIKKRKAKK